MIPAISISNGTPTQGMPLVFVVVLSMIKDAYEDYKKSVNDRTENEENKVECCKTFSEPEVLKVTRWEDVQVGDIVKVEEGQFFPSDLVLLYSSGPKGSLYVETKNLDGETNLKLKQTQKNLQAKFAEYEKDNEEYNDKNLL